MLRKSDSSGHSLGSPMLVNMSLINLVLINLLLINCFPGATRLCAQVATERLDHPSRIHQVSSLDVPPVQRSNHALPLRSETEPTGLRARESAPSLPSFTEYRSATSNDSPTPTSGEQNLLAGPAVTVTSSLAVVLGLFALMVWMMRRFGNRSLGQTALPTEVVQSLGTTTLDARTQVNLLKCGGRVLVVAQTATGVFPLSEITSPEEVRLLIAQCQPNSKHAFAQTLQAFEQESAPRGFVGPDAPTTEVHPQRSSRGRLFTTA